jgi:hypothetical protein
MGGKEIGWLLWAALALAALASLSLAALPARFWSGWFSCSRRAFAGGVALGWIAYVLGVSSQALWGSLQRSTFAMVTLLLEAAGQQRIIVDPQKFVIGTQSFAVQLSPECSGYEGIGRYFRVAVSDENQRGNSEGVQHPDCGDSEREQKKSLRK